VDSVPGHSISSGPIVPAVQVAPNNSNRPAKRLAGRIIANPNAAVVHPGKALDGARVAAFASGIISYHFDAFSLLPSIKAS
jgi:hypothetical protein